MTERPCAGSMRDMKKGKVYMSMETVNGTYGSEEQKTEEMTRYLNGLKRYHGKRDPDLHGWKAFRSERVGKAV